jgi:hypothetical protein
MLSWVLTAGEPPIRTGASAPTGAALRQRWDEGPAVKNISRTHVPHRPTWPYVRLEWRSSTAGPPRLSSSHLCQQGLLVRASVHLARTRTDVTRRAAARHRHSSSILYLVRFRRAVAARPHPRGSSRAAAQPQRRSAQRTPSLISPRAGPLFLPPRPCRAHRATSRPTAPALAPQRRAAPCPASKAPH